MGLCLTRKKLETIHIGDAIVTVVAVRGAKVQLAIEAPEGVRILRGEVVGRAKQPRPIGGREAA